MKAIQTFTVMAMLFSFTSQVEAKKVNLRYQLKTGDQFKLELSSNQEIDQVSGTELLSSKSINYTTYEFKVTEVSATGDMKINVALKAFSIESSGPQFGDMKYNSSDKSAVPDFATDKAALLDQAYSFTHSPFGVITDVKAPPGILEKMKKILEATGMANFGFDIDEAVKEFDGPGFSTILKQMFMVYPQEGVDVNVPWEAESAINKSLMVNKIISDYKLVRSSAASNEIEVAGKIVPYKNTPAKEMFGMKYYFEFQGDRNGSLILYPKTGISSKAEFKTLLKGAITISSSQNTIPTSIPMTIRATEKIIKL